jgi:hypothetical protein
MGGKLHKQQAPRQVQQLRPLSFHMKLLCFDLFCLLTLSIDQIIIAPQLFRTLQVAQLVYANHLQLNTPDQKRFVNQ